ncbi:hypothetical protein SAZ11_40505 [Streptomyces sp. FXJ1.4098]|nr:hypothetical protein [Streptomyces sp. FXJ1.4098]
MADLEGAFDFEADGEWLGRGLALSFLAAEGVVAGVVDDAEGEGFLSGDLSSLVDGSSSGALELGSDSVRSASWSCFLSPPSKPVPKASVLATATAAAPESTATTGPLRLFRWRPVPGPAPPRRERTRRPRSARPRPPRSGRSG